MRSQQLAAIRESPIARVEPYSALPCGAGRLNSDACRHHGVQVAVAVKITESDSHVMESSEELSTVPKNTAVVEPNTVRRDVRYEYVEIAVAIQIAQCEATAWKHLPDLAATPEFRSLYAWSSYSPTRGLR